MIQKFEFHETSIPGLIEITPFNADDIRGCFTKDYSKEVFEANGIQHDLAEVFYTTSHRGCLLYTSQRIFPIKYCYQLFQPRHIPGNTCSEKNIKQFIYIIFIIQMTYYTPIQPFRFFIKNFTSS